MAGFWKLVLVLDDHTATAHRPTVPPCGEPTVIVVIAIAVAFADHVLNHFVQATARTGQRITTVSSDRQARGTGVWGLGCSEENRAYTLS